MWIRGGRPLRGPYRHHPSDTWEKAIAVISNALIFENAVDIGISLSQLIEALDTYEKEFGPELDLETGMGDDLILRVSDIRHAICNIAPVSDIGVKINVDDDGEINITETKFCMKFTWSE